MFLLLPTTVIMAVYIAAAVLPAAFLLKKIYNLDTVEKEPKELLISLLIGGVLAALASIVLETIGQILLGISKLDSSSAAYILSLAFLVVAAVEEGTKFFFLYRRSWNHPSFDYRFDGIVYSAFVSLGFAAFENIKYVFHYGLTVAFPRAFLSIPGHLGFAIVFGYFYGRAKLSEKRGDKENAKMNLITGYLIAVALHGFYDACAMMQTAFASLLFIIFVIVMYIRIIRLVKREAWTDEEL